METFTQWKQKQQKTNRYLKYLAVVFGLLIAVFETYSLVKTGDISWSAIDVCCIGYALVFIVVKTGYFRNNMIQSFRENKILFEVKYILYVIAGTALSIYTLTTVISKNGNSEQTMQFTLISSFISLAGFLVTLVSSRINLKEYIKAEFISAAQKYALAVILFIFFIITIKLVDMIGAIDIDSLSLDPESISRGVFFWLASTCFYSAVILLSIALVDTVFALRGLKYVNKSD